VGKDAERNIINSISNDQKLWLEENHIKRYIKEHIVKKLSWKKLGKERWCARRSHEPEKV